MDQLTKRVLIVIGFAIAATAIFIAWGSYTPAHRQTAAPGWTTPRAALGVAPAPLAVHQPTAEELLAQATTLAAALRVAVPTFRDSNETLDPGASRFAIWAAGHLTWTELQALPETKRALVLRDPEGERGKRLCWSGTIAEIKADRTAGLPIFLGGMVDYNSDVVRFNAVGYVGELVQHSEARICGVVTGTITYTNAGGVIEHAANVVGMFDLPRNKPAPAVPARQQVAPAGDKAPDDWRPPPPAETASAPPKEWLN